MHALGGAILSLGFPCCSAPECLTPCAALSCQRVWERPCGEAKVLEGRAHHTHFHRLAQLGASLGATKHHTFLSNLGGWKGPEARGWRHPGINAAGVRGSMPH